MSMIGKIHLIKINHNKIVPALCLSMMDGNCSLFAQIKSTNRQGIVKNMEYKGTKKQSSNRTNNFYIGQPKGLKSPSVVMLRKVYQVRLEDIKKELASINTDILAQVIEKRNFTLEQDSLHLELHQLKKKILLAQFNNEKYGDLQKRLDIILKKLNYNNPKKIQKAQPKGYRNYRDTPSSGYIKVYLGGR
jgi:hypothetical protein